MTDPLDRNSTDEPNPIEADSRPWRPCAANGSEPDNLPSGPELKNAYGEQCPAQEVIDTLVGMIEGPYLSREGSAYCLIPSEHDGASLQVPLRCQRVRSYLKYQYHKSFGVCPLVSIVRAAIDLVEGRLLSTRSCASSLKTCPTFLCFAHLIDKEGSGVDSASGLLKKLRDLTKDKKLLKGYESLPDSATAMGKWLASNQLELSWYGLELSQPTRRAMKRLWAWRRIHPNDASDTSTTHGSWPTEAASPQNKESVKPDDTMSDDQLFQELGDHCDEDSK